jgi:hypothetical protein
MFLSEAFYSDKAIGTQIKSPVQLLLSLLEYVELKPKQHATMQRVLQALGQRLFYAPNVKGWPGNRAWINTNTLVLRYNIAAYLIYGLIDDNGRRIWRKIDKNIGPTPLKLNKYLQEFNGSSAGDLVSGLTQRALGRALDQSQRKIMIDLLGGDATAIINLKVADPNKLRALVHMVMSMAEYQLC